MTIDPEQLLAAKIPRIEQRYTARDCILYALGIGVGLDPMDETDLPFVDETRLKVEPTLANVLGYPGFWQRDPAFGLDWVKTVHGEHAVRIHKPLPSAGHVVGASRIVDLVDKGERRGALIFVEREITDQASGDLLATVRQTVFCRGDGGFGGPAKVLSPPHPIPERAPDTHIDIPTSPQTALIYRLSGDYNPLHSDPATARDAGFERPILHGLATFGVTGHGLVKRVADSDPTALRAMGGRFSSPVFPGETLRLEIWRDAPGQVTFRTTVPARSVVVVNNGFAEFAA
ncbi:MaoC/PaaZ C-terminal domain-containing protein [Piscinibacter sp. XHJ-5]|uniref:MaoC/PaaZ C-terminal domain-containing protein n=1 Tax=Piscinibacter sp. XHJ-5 TaxID=3037797 RepID=UPI0024530867|nr:MaoC/PaaZ C-terminal domain-containing protein [Piscinibacter sp. XHJ-5]